MAYREKKVFRERKSARKREKERSSSRLEAIRDRMQKLTWKERIAKEPEIERKKKNIMT